MNYEAILYGIKCDRCREVFEDSEGHTVFFDKGDAEEGVAEDSWHCDGDKHYCPNCYFVDDNDVITVKPSIPHDFFKFQNTLKALTHTIHRFSEIEQHYILTNHYCYKNLDPARISILREIIPDFTVEYNTPDKCDGKPYVIEVISIPKNAQK